jgi:hypothetical protein
MKYVTLLSAFSTLPIRWRGAVKPVIVSLGTALVDFTFLSTTCSFGATIVANYLTFSLLPIAIGLLGFGLNALTKYLTFFKGINMFLTMVQMFFVPMTLHATSPFRFVSHADAGNVKTMLEHPRVQAGSEEHSAFIGIAAFSILGVVAFMAVGAWACYLLGARSTSETRKANLLIAFNYLHKKFRSGYAIWGLIYLTRNLGVILIATLLQHIPLQQICLAFILLLGVAVWAARVFPFKIAILSALDVYLAIVLSLLLASGAITLGADLDAADLDAELAPVMMTIAVLLELGAVAVVGLLVTLVAGRMRSCCVTRAAEQGIVKTTPSASTKSELEDNTLGGAEAEKDEDENRPLLRQN